MALDNNSKKFSADSWFVDSDSSLLIPDEFLAKLKDLNPKTSFRYYIAVLKEYFYIEKIQSC